MRCGRYRLTDRIDGDYLGIERDFNLLLAIKALGMNEELRFIARADQKLFGERWPVVR